MRPRIPARAAGWSALALALGLGLGPRVAEAQDGGYALQSFTPSPAGDVFVGVPSPDAAGHLAPRGYVMFDYAHRPIRLAGGDVAVVGGQGVLRLDAALALWDRLLVSVDVPATTLTVGEAPPATLGNFTTLEAPRFGDVRIGLRGRIAGDDGGPIQLGLGSYLFTPSGNQTHYAGEGAVRGAFHLALGGRIGDDVGFVYGVALGPELRASDRPHALVYGAGLGLLLADDIVQLGAELGGQTPFGGRVPLSSQPVTTAAASTNAEVLFSTKVRVLGGLTFGAAGGPGLGSAVGTPVFRVLGLIGWTPLPEPPVDEEAAPAGDRDHDGIDDDIDACPDVEGEPNADPTKDGCPASDRDEDGIRDIDDACPNIAGKPNADITKNGCPGDTDGDGIHDGIDACPAAVGVESDDPKKNGCPADRDGDGITDADDACPGAAGDPSDDPQKNGCPADPDRDGIRYGDDACPLEAGPRSAIASENGCPPKPKPRPGTTPQPGGPPTVAIEGDEHFEYMLHGAELVHIVTPDKEKRLNALAAELRSDSVKRAILQGHTDDSGDEGYNQMLSERRAEKLKQWLVIFGRVPADKLVVRGFGATRPVGDNRVRTGREQNRRVEVVIER